MARDVLREMLLGGGLAVLACSAFLSSSCSRRSDPERGARKADGAAAPATKPHAPRPPIFGQIEGAAAGSRFSLSLSDCGAAGCAVMVVGTGGAQAPPATARLAWNLPAGPTSSAPPPPERGGGLLLEAPKYTSGWRIGAEESAALLTANVIRFGPVGDAILLQAEAGFEHVKRRQALVVPLPAGRLATWIREDGAGPHRTAIAVLDGAGGGEVPIYIDVFLDPTPDAPDTLSVRVLTLDTSRDRLEDRSPAEAGARVPAVLAGRFSAVAAARSARASTECLADMLVLPASQFAGERGRKAGFVLAEVGNRKDLVESQARRLSSCAGRHDVRVGSWIGDS